MDQCNELNNDKAVCRIAPAILGLSIRHLWEITGLLFETLLIEVL